MTVKSTNNYDAIAIASPSDWFKNVMQVFLTP